MNTLLTFTEFLTLCGDKVEIRGVSYEEISNALSIPKRTLYNESSLNHWKVKKHIGNTVYFDPQSVYEWVIHYTVQRQRRQAA